MHLPPKHYVDFAPSEVGEQVHINHEGCEAGVDRKKRLYIKREETCIIAFCHHCGGKGIYHLKGSKPRHVSVLRNKGVVLRKVKDVHFSPSCEFDVKKFSLPAKAWLYRYRLTDKQIKDNFIGYDPISDRVVLPIFDDNGLLIFWQARALHGEQPKYYSETSVDKPYFLYEHPTSKVLVVVEDMLSAIRVGEHANALALLGTTLTDESIVALLSKGYTSIVIWLDDDMAGRQATLKMKPMLQLLFNNLTWVHFKQPKECTSIEIQTNIGIK